MSTTSQRPPSSRPIVPNGTPRERLMFNVGTGTVSGRGVAEAAIARDARPRSLAAAFSEPRDWGYVGLLAFTAVLLTRPQDTLPFLEPFHLAEVFAIIGIAPMVLHRFASRRPAFRVTAETIGLLAFGFVILATVPFSIWPGGALQEFNDSYLKAFVVLVLMMNTLTTPKRLERMTWLILLCVGYVAARGVVDYARGVNLIEGDRLTAAVNGIYGNPNDLATTMVTFLPGAAVVALSGTNSALRRTMAAGLVVIMMATIVFTKSRGGLLGLVAMLLTLVVLGRRIRPGFATITIIAVLAATPLMPSSFWSRMASIVDEKQDQQEYTGSRETRRVVMQEGINTFLERPLTGVGAGQFANYNPPGRKERWRETHNALIQVAAETGIFGLIAFSFLILRGFVVGLTTRRVLRKAKGRGAVDPALALLSDRDRQFLYAHTVAMVAGLAGWFTCALFASVAFNWTFYYVLALIVAPREILRYRMLAARVAERIPKKSSSVRGPEFSSGLAPAAG